MSKRTKYFTYLC